MGQESFDENFRPQEGFPASTRRAMGFSGSWETRILGRKFCLILVSKTLVWQLGSLEIECRESTFSTLQETSPWGTAEEVFVQNPKGLESFGGMEGLNGQSFRPLFCKRPKNGPLTRLVFMISPAVRDVLLSGSSLAQVQNRRLRNCSTI